MDSAGCGPRTVLVVDDEPDLCEIIRRMLDGKGYVVLVAAGFAAAVAQSDALDGPIDLLITDLRMPDGDGKALASHIHATRPETAVLYMSGLLTDDHDNADGNPATGSPADGNTADGQGWHTTILAKPFTPAELFSAVSASLTQA